MISPQGYKLGEDPKSKNPFWGEGEDSNVNKIYATASVDEGTGVPSVTTSKTVSGSDITFDFAFHNLKGERGPQGPAGATGYITFGGKQGMTYEPRLEENLYKTSENFSKNINESASINYRIGGVKVNDTLNINGILNIPTGTLLETTRDYYIGGNEYIKSNVESATMELNPSDFTISLTSGNTAEITSLQLSNITSTENAVIDVLFNVSNGTNTVFSMKTINIGTLNVTGQYESNTYFLEPRK